MTSTGHYRWSILQSGQRIHLEVGPECQWHHQDHPDSANMAKQQKQGETRWNQSEIVQKEKESNIPTLGVAIGPLPAVEASNQRVCKVARMWHECHIHQNAHKQQYGGTNLSYFTKLYAYVRRYMDSKRAETAHCGVCCSYKGTMY